MGSINEKEKQKHRIRQQAIRDIRELSSMPAFQRYMARLFNDARICEPTIVVEESTTIQNQVENEKKSREMQVINNHMYKYFGELRAIVPEAAIEIIKYQFNNYRGK